MINLEQLLLILRNPNDDLKDNLSMYHENDIAEALGELSKDERLRVYKFLDFEYLAEIFSYFDDAKPYFDELDEEKVGYEKLGRSEDVKNIEEQKAVIEKYLPKLMSEDEIRKVIASLEDKSMPSVMKHFKTNYDGKVDMSLVSKIARE